MIRKRLTQAGFTGLVFILSAAAMSQKNHAPVVSIITPQPEDKIRAGQQLFYEISVSDLEDGETAYEEIATTEVYLSLSYFQERERALAVAEQQEEAPALTLMKASGCFTCHAHNTNLGGPPFREIAMKYDEQGGMEHIGQSIREGSTGEWGDETIMPAHPQLATEEIHVITHWITEEKHRQETIYLQGTSGSFTVKEEQKALYLVLKASYRDHGDGKEGSERLGLIGQWHLVE